MTCRSRVTSDWFCTSTNKVSTRQTWRSSDLALRTDRVASPLDDTDGGIGWDRQGVLVSKDWRSRAPASTEYPRAPLTSVFIFAADRIDLVEPVVVPVLGGSIAPTVLR